MDGSLFNWLKHAVRGLLVAFPLVALFGFVFPWPAGEQALSRYPGQTPIMVAYFSHSKSWYNGGSLVRTTKEQTRSYVLFPSVFNNPRIVTVSQKDNNEPTVSESSIPLIVIALVGMGVFAVFGIWYFGVRLQRQDQLSPEEAKTFYGSQLPQREFGRRIS